MSDFMGYFPDRKRESRQQNNLIIRALLSLYSQRETKHNREDLYLKI